MSNIIKNIEIQKKIGEELVSIYPKTSVENVEGIGAYPTCAENSGITVGLKIWTGTQSEYDALGEYSDTTLYFIKEE